MKALLFVLSLTPAITELVRSFEIEGLTGKQKLELVLTSLLAGLETVSPELAKEIGIEKIKTYASLIIANIVAVFNAAGIFKTKAVVDVKV